jgi:hypothetical protein
MRYFKLVAEFVLPNGNSNTSTIYQSCEDIDYDQETVNAELHARVSAKRMCGGEEPIVTITVTELTLAQYTAIIPVVVTEDLGDPQALEDELNNE